MNEEFTQRLAALEKKFQQAIREKELLRKQLDVRTFFIFWLNGFTNRINKFHFYI